MTPASTDASAAETRPFRVLTLDGGGVRGLLQLQVLKYLEALTGRQTRELFDHIGGTSVGGILALALSCSGKSAVDIEKFFLALAPRIFPSRSFTRVRQLFGPKYRSDALKKGLADFFGGATPQTHAATGLTVTAFDMTAFTPVVFGRSSPVSCMDLALATSAGPTYFPPHKLLVNGQPHAFEDGGLWANNPTMQALVDVGWGGTRPTVVLSLGTGVPAEGWSYDTVNSWGLLGQIAPTLAAFVDGSVEAVDHQVRETFDHDGPGNAYVRLQALLPGDLAPMDQADPDHVARLILEGQELLKTNQLLLSQLAPRLVGGVL